MATQHTPGEWKTEDDTFVYALNSEGSNRFYASVQGGWIAKNERTTREERIANARLIAAAPELLAALERTEKFLRGDPLADALMREGGITLGEYIRAALSKARGE